jgi:hypothetical protein
MPGEFDILSPWDSSRYFSAPVETSYGAIAQNTQICKTDYKRVVLLIGLLSSSDSIRLSLKSGSFGGTGFVLTGTMPPLILTQREHGILCQSEWFVAQAPATGMTVIEVFLQDWPEQFRDG